MKIIGIPTRDVTIEGTKGVVQKSYLNQLEKYQLQPLILSLKNISSNELDLCSGFLIPGGGDIDPSYFNEGNKGLSKDINPQIDEIDRYIVEYATKAKKPLLGICRGIQAINIFLGGSIYQDIGNNHRHIIQGHKVKTKANRLLHFKENIEVNSFHHQAIKELPQDFLIVASHYDGTIEAIIHRTLPIIGIQWHPELLPETEETRIIFDTFINLLNLKNS
ncbi:MAG: type 1 glutamine amidotransferase [Bacilli bacterium]|nr:type 1 glutamine amidotransferase [Bacilli bacterium]